MTTPLQLRQNGARLPFGEWFNAIINAFNQQFTAGSVQVVAAAGATQGNATQINGLKGAVVKVTVTASTEGVKLPTASTGARVTILADPLVGVKVYPFLGDKIGTAVTNAAVALVKAKSTIYLAIDAVSWRTVTGA